MCPKRCCGNGIEKFGWMTQKFLRKRMNDVVPSHRRENVAIAEKSFFPPTRLGGQKNKRRQQRGLENKSLFKKTSFEKRTRKKEKNVEVK